MTSFEIPPDTQGLLIPEEPRLTVAAAEAWIQESCFTPGPTGRMGLELELFLGHAGDPSLQSPLAEGSYQGLFERLQGTDVEGSLTLEPGGQLELSSLPKESLTEAVHSVHRSLALLGERAGELGVSLIGAGISPFGEPRRITQAPRYRAMEDYFRPWQPAGTTMMCSTASLQVNTEAGTSTREIRDRWDLLYAVGPTLAAAFANSSWFGGRRTSWKSRRLAAWLALDPSRTGVPHAYRQNDPAAAFAEWAMDAPLMMLRRPNENWTAPAGLTFREWLQAGRTAVPDRSPATLGDLQHHLSTLFPYVRPRGYFEVRYIDAQPGCWWAVPAAVIAALVSEPFAGEQARDICADSLAWEAAARHGLDSPVTASAAVQLLALASERLRSNPETTLLGRQVEEYMERWTLRGRSPADDHPSMWGKRLNGCAVEGCVTGV